MTAPGVPAPAEGALEDYSQRFALEVDLVRQLAACALAQCEAAEARDVVALARAALDRQSCMDALQQLEQALAPLRAGLLRHVQASPTVPRHAAILAMHDAAKKGIAEIVERDARMRPALEALRNEARTGSQQIEAGEVTLAAYKRVVAPPPASAGLVDSRG